eukprot:TRINITY_DN6780_c0_g1_i2.p1 TRINITY_DN6780_c0_g1~~TRINITY_DN6780_c0_g1_i2.p1  ORF type:complete len:281 (-),score=16.59 TRINITY_DN6780_c0_g1_i2:413-1255(-)
MTKNGPTLTAKQISVGVVDKGGNLQALGQQNSKYYSTSHVQYRLNQIRGPHLKGQSDADFVTSMSNPVVREFVKHVDSHPLAINVSTIHQRNLFKCMIEEAILANSEAASVDVCLDMTFNFARNWKLIGTVGEAPNKGTLFHCASFVQNDTEVSYVFHLLHMLEAVQHIALEEISSVLKFCVDYNAQQVKAIQLALGIFHTGELPNAIGNVHHFYNNLTPEQRVAMRRIGEPFFAKMSIGCEVHWQRSLLRVRRALAMDDSTGARFTHDFMQLRRADCTL